MPPPEPTPETPIPEPELSLAEHEAQYAPGGVSVPETDTEPASATEPDPDQPARGRDDKGRFQPSTPAERRARSHVARRGDEGRIGELTKKLRAAERERDEWKSKASPVSAARTEPETPPRAGEFPPAAAPPAPAAVARPAARVRPTPEDKNEDGSPTYATWEAYEDALEEYREAGRQERRAQETEAARVSADWNARTEAAEKKYDNFREVALLKPTRIPAGSLLDAFILEDEGGADVLYHFQQNDAELDQVLAMSPFKQVKYLSLLSQRLTTESAEPRRTPAATGEPAAPRQPVNRPPTPVRTAPARPPDEPPGDDASLAEHERVYGTRQRRPF